MDILGRMNSMDQDLTSEIISKSIRYHSFYGSWRLPKNVREDKQWSLCKSIRWKEIFVIHKKPVLIAYCYKSDLKRIKD